MTDWKLFSDSFDSWFAKLRELPYHLRYLIDFLIQFHPYLQMCPDSKGIGVNTGFAAGSDLFIDCAGGFGRVDGSLDPNGLAVEFTGTDFGHMLHAIHFFVILRMLVIVVGLESQFGLTYTATEASTMEEGEIFEGACNYIEIQSSVQPFVNNVWILEPPTQY